MKKYFVCFFIFVALFSQTAASAEDLPVLVSFAADGSAFEVKILKNSLQIRDIVANNKKCSTVIMSPQVKEGQRFNTGDAFICISIEGAFENHLAYISDHPRETAAGLMAELRSGQLEYCRSLEVVVETNFGTSLWKQRAQ